MLRGLFLAAALCIAGGAPALALDKVSIVVFGPPSLGAFLQPVIKEFKLDEANGLTIDFAERTYRADGEVAGEVRYRLDASKPESAEVESVLEPRPSR